MTKPGSAVIDASWIQEAPQTAVAHALLEYRYFVHRFTQWLALAIGHAEDQRIRQLVLPNLIDEQGGMDNRPSHLDLLDRCLDSCGVKRRLNHRPLASTVRAEAWFFGVCSGVDTHAALCVLGPGTESISQTFLGPLETAIRRAWPEKPIDITYFDVHRPEIEAAHANGLLDAIKLVESGAPDNIARKLITTRAEWTDAAIRQHASFWNGLRRQVADGKTARMVEP